MKGNNKEKKTDFFHIPSKIINFYFIFIAYIDMMLNNHCTFILRVKISVLKVSKYLYLI